MTEVIAEQLRQLRMMREIHDGTSDSWEMIRLIDDLIEILSR